jgi:hypothetical protein
MAELPIYRDVRDEPDACGWLLSPDDRPDIVLCAGPSTGWKTVRKEMRVLRAGLRDEVRCGILAYTVRADGWIEVGINEQDPTTIYDR